MNTETIYLRAVYNQVDAFYAVAAVCWVIHAGFYFSSTHDHGGNIEPNTITMREHTQHSTASSGPNNYDAYGVRACICIGVQRCHRFIVRSHSKDPSYTRERRRGREKFKVATDLCWQRLALRPTTIRRTLAAHGAVEGPFSLSLGGLRNHETIVFLSLCHTVGFLLLPLFITYRSSSSRRRFKCPSALPVACLSGALID